jgi:hypothetical protein
MTTVEKTLLTASSIIATFFIGCILFFIIAFCDRKETVKIVNKKNGEKIYLIKTTWGNDERMAIGLDKKLKGGVGYLYPEKFNVNYSTRFFYKLSNDTLFIYNGGFEKPINNKFKTPIKLIELETNDFESLCKDNKYKELGLKVFPESHPRIVDSILKER